MSAQGAVVFGVVVFLVGLLTGTRAATIGGAYVSAAAWLSSYYAKGALRRVVYRRKMSSPRATVGDTVALRVEIENRKPMPVLWLKCDDEVPDAGTIGNLPSHRHYKPRRATFTNVTYLKWFERVEREFTMECLARGVFSFGPVKLSCGDVLGFRDQAAEVPVVDTLTVYPRMAGVRGVPWDEHFPLGDRPSRGWIHPDPLTVAGTRPYVAGTPLRQVAWRATARTGTLQRKLLEPTVQRNVIVALSLSTGEHYWEGVNSEILETGVFVCASLCRELWRRGTPFGLAANSAGARARRGALLTRPGSSQAHLSGVLEVLARLTMPWMEFRTVLRFLGREVSPDTGVLVIMTRQLEADWDEVVGLATTGRPVVVLVLSTDERFAPYYRKVPTYVLSAPVDWRSSEVIAFDRVT